MGSYAIYKCSELPLYLFKNESASRPILMEAFVPGDLVREPGEDDPYRYIGYKTTCGAARARLDVLGYTLDRAFSYFNLFAEKFLAKYDDPYEEFDPLRIQVPGDEFSWRDALAVLKDPGELLAAYRQLFDNAEALKSHSREIFEGKPLPIDPCNPYAELLMSINEEYPYVSVVEPESQNPLWDLRIMLECVDPNTPLEYDFTDVANYWDYEAEGKLLSYLNIARQSV